MKLLKRVLLTVFLLNFLLINGFSQCPEGDVYFSAQADIEAFSTEYPNCTSIGGSLTLDNSNNQEPMDLAALSQLQEVQENLGIVWIGHFDSNLGMDVAGSMEGLENITSVGSLSIGSAPNSSPSPIQSLQQLNGIAGQLESFILSNVQIDEELPNFPGITAIGNLSMNNLHVEGSTPQFPGLSALSNMVVYSSPMATSTFTTLYIPDNLPSIQAYPLQGIETSLLWIEGNENLQEIAGGNALWKIDNADIRDNLNLTVLDGFAGVTQVKTLAMQGCRTEFFDSFKALSVAQKIILDVNNYTNCTEPQDELVVSLGQDSEALRVTREGFILNVNDIETLEVTSALSTVGGLEITTSGVSHLNGFSTLDSIVKMHPANSGELLITIDELHALPNFSELKYIGNDMVLNFGLNSVNIQNLEGLEALEWIEDDFQILDFWSVSTLESLDGLDNLEYVHELSISGFPQLSDISVLEDVDTILVFKLSALPALDQELTFTDMTSLPFFQIYDTGLESIPSFPQVATIGTLKLENHDNITVADGFPAASSIGTLVLLNNAQLQSLDFNENIDVTRAELRNNPQLESCAESPLICHILSVADPLQVDLENNGTGCNDLEEILAQCILSNSPVENPDFSIRKATHGQLLIDSPISGNTALRIYDGTGKVVQADNLALMEGENYVTLTEMSLGIYFVQLSHDRLLTVQKVFFGEKR